MQECLLKVVAAYIWN